MIDLPPLVSGDSHIDAFIQNMRSQLSQKVIRLNPHVRLAEPSH
jgi:hypothetical protein